MKWAIRSGLLALFATVLAGSVKADTVYSYTLSQGSTTIATFELPQFPATDPSTAATYMGATDMGFILTPLNLTINGTASSDSLEFFNSLMDGGLEDDPPLTTDTPAFNFVGDQLYSGDESPSDLTNPVKMATGPFTLFACTDPDCSTVGDTPYTLSTVVSETVPTPEPSGFLLLGMGLTGVFLIRKRYAAD